MNETVDLTMVTYLGVSGVVMTSTVSDLKKTVKSL